MIKENLTKNELLKHSTAQSIFFSNTQISNQPVTMIRQSSYAYEHNQKFTRSNPIKTLKYGRSSSLPLKIMIRDTTSNSKSSNVSTSQSWTDNSFSSDKLNSPNGFINYQFSFSERFLDLIDLNTPGNVLSFDSSSSTSFYNSNNINLRLFKFCRDKQKSDNCNKTSISNEQSSDTPNISSIEDILRDDKIANDLKESDVLNIQTVNLKNDEKSDNENKSETSSESNQEDRNQNETQVELDLKCTTDVTCSSDQIIDQNLDESKSDLDISTDEVICHNTTLNDMTVSDEDTKQDDESVNSVISSEEIRYEGETISENDQEFGSSENEEEEEEEEEDSIFFDLIPKKSCLRKTSIDSSNCGGSPLGVCSPGFLVSSPLTPTTDISLSLISISSNGSESTPFKKRVSFADNVNQELVTVRIMTEPSNCPPKLTSKIVYYFLNREFNYNTENSSNSSNFFSLNQNHSVFNDLNYTQRDNNFSSTRIYDNYRINGPNYSTDLSKPCGSLAVYSLNFSQPASDYLNFRKRLDHNLISLENVILDRFQITGTVKVKNISYHKNVFIRCSHNNWLSYYDYQAQFVPGDYFNENSSIYSSKNYSLSTVFYQNHNNTYDPIHKDHDTFRFDFQLPKTVDQNNFNHQNKINNNNSTASIQFCICYRSGLGNEAKEFWDNNDGKNYHVLQYNFDLERLKIENNSKTNKIKANKSNKHKSHNNFKNDQKNFNRNGVTHHSTQHNNGVYY